MLINENIIVKVFLY